MRDSNMSGSGSSNSSVTSAGSNFVRFRRCAAGFSRATGSSGLSGTITPAEINVSTAPEPLSGMPSSARQSPGT